MKKVILIAIIVAIGWYGSYLYKQHALTFVQNPSSNLTEKEVKCITKDGSVLYGNVPHGITCEKIEKIGGSLTVVSSGSVNSSEKKDISNPPKENNKVSTFKCDGRIYCSQMTSCEEAAFFLKNCPNVKMDGNNDGIPCEKQWCGS